MAENILNVTISPPRTSTSGFLQLLNDHTPYLSGDPAGDYVTPDFNYVSSTGWNFPQPILQSTAVDADVEQTLDGENNADLGTSTLPNQLKDDIVRRLKGKKGGEQIGFNGFLYSHDRKKVLSDGRSRHYWQCVMKGSKKLNCTARLITTADEPIGVIKEPSHSHEPDPTQVSVATVKTRYI